MADKAYIDGRKKYSRPQAVLFSESPGILSSGVYVPPGYEAGNADNTNKDFIILSDHNRSALDIGLERIENRQRMVNGRMRSYWIADKRSLSISWEMLPSRSFSKDPNFDTSTGLPTGIGTQYTIDGGAGGAELLDWYDNHYGTFYVFLSYDRFTEFGRNDAAYGHLAEYQEVLEMYISDFSYSVEKRGGSNFDMWNCSISLEEA
jgi:hypothetical protein